MIKVMEVTKLNSETIVLVCDMFLDSVVTKNIKTNSGIISDFAIDTPKECFSLPKTRDILVYGVVPEEITQIEFI